MKCAACGVEIGAEDQVCPSCGAPTTVYRSCDRCGHQLGPEDRFCPICAVREAAGVEPVEAEQLPAKVPRRARRLALPRRPVLLGVVLLAALAGAVLLTLSAGVDVSRWLAGAPALRLAQGSEPQQLMAGGEAAKVSTPEQRAGAGGSVSGDVASPAATEVSSPTASPAAVAGSARAETTPTKADLVPLPPLPKIDLGQKELAGRWDGFITIRRMSLGDGSTREQEEFDALQQNSRLVPRALEVEFDAAAADSGMVTAATVDPEGESSQSEQEMPAVRVSVPRSTAPYNLQDGSLSFQLQDGTSFEGQTGWTDTRYLIEGTWKASGPWRIADGSERRLLLEGTWTVAKSP